MVWTNITVFIVGSMVTDSTLNTMLRDNMNELALHSHMGGSGSGTGEVGNLIYITSIDAAAPAAPGGTLTYLASSATALIMRSGAAGAVRAFSNSTHTHGGL